ncbi:hypothetical protein TrST_g2047 [Triparma strigata]|uniref:Tafazzin family protein n=1 Tax=Triparma strigata TaxID=1606541 RepID=A0A9W7BNE3_9STRA|nr:hypothetical protein TrST_g2047 [Triparma strigata]
MSHKKIVPALTLTLTPILAGLAGALYYRPTFDVTDGYWGGPKHFGKGKPVTSQQLQDRNWLRNETYNISDHVEDGDPQVLKAGRAVIVAVIATVIELGMQKRYGYNSFNPVPSKEYDDLMSKAFNIKDTETLLTVSNHCSTLDDPILFGCLMPGLKSWNYEHLRWSLCSQEICFKNPFLAAFFGGGKVLPIKRGAGLDQPMLLDFCRRAAQGGQWIHLFPEGKIFQSGSLGAEYYRARSDERAREIGRLKWGAGKVVAHCPKKLLVVPFHHLAMEGINPQREDGELRTHVPQGGNDVSLRVGKYIGFDDLIEEHERKHGKLWKYKVKPEEGERWKSSEEEKKLYTKIVLRIEGALKLLEEESKRDDSEIVVEGRRRLRLIKEENDRDRKVAQK